MLNCVWIYVNNVSCYFIASHRPNTCILPQQKKVERVGSHSFQSLSEHGKVKCIAIITIHNIMKMKKCMWKISARAAHQNVALKRVNMRKKNGTPYTHPDKSNNSCHQRMLETFFGATCSNKFILFISLHELNKCLCVSVISSLWSYVMNDALLSTPPPPFYSSLVSFFCVCQKLTVAWRIFCSLKTLKRTERKTRTRMASLFEPLNFNQVIWMHKPTNDEKKMLINFAKLMFLSGARVRSFRLSHHYLLENMSAQIAKTFKININYQNGR